jgi:hypothetical protein
MVFEGLKPCLIPFVCSDVQSCILRQLFFAEIIQLLSWEPVIVSGKAKGMIRILKTRSSLNQPSDQPMNERTNQPTNRPTDQPNKQTDKQTNNRVNLQYRRILEIATSSKEHRQRRVSCYRIHSQEGTSLQTHLTCIPS